LAIGVQTAGERNAGRKRIEVPAVAKGSTIAIEKGFGKEFRPPLNESPKRLYAQKFCLLFLMAGNNR